MQECSCALARMAKLADAADLKSAGRKAMGVQIPLRAPFIMLIIIDLEELLRSCAFFRWFAIDPL